MTPDHSRQNFAHTQWSLAMRADAPPADAREALVDLCLRYWYPIYAYLRRFGHGPASAQEITRGFLQHLFRHVHESGTALVRGRFRRYLLARLRTYLANDRHDKPGGDVVMELNEPPPDLELRNQRDNANAQSPEQAYERSFALELLERACGRLRAEASQTARLDMYDALEPFLASDPSQAESDELARRLDTRSVTITVALRRLRQRFRELIDVELADTVASADELQAEQEALYAVLRECE